MSVSIKEHTLLELGIMKKLFTGISLLLTSTGILAQTQTSYSLKEAIEYATTNNVTVKNSSLDKLSADAKKNEVRGQGLPQVNMQADLIHNFQAQSNILENTPGTAFYNPSLANGAVLSTRFALQNQLIPVATASQIIFDKGFLGSIEAAKAARSLSEKNVAKTRIDVALETTKAYYAVLVSDKQLGFIDANLGRLDSTLKDMQAQYSVGLAREIDVDQAEVNLNNLKEEKRRVTRLLDLSKLQLKYLMSLPKDAAINLTDELDEKLLADVMQTESTQVNYSNRIEYSMLENQYRLNKLDTRAANGARYPKLLGIANFGYNPGASQFSNLTQSERWIYYSYVGLRLQVPVFTGGANYYKVQQKRIEEQRTINNKENLERQIDLQVSESLINLQNSIESLQNQKRNMDLSKKNLDMIRAEHEAGIARIVEVTIAEAAFKDAQTNYFNGLYSALISKADYQKATGTLLQ